MNDEHCMVSQILCCPLHPSPGFGISLPVDFTADVVVEGDGNAC